MTNARSRRPKSGPASAEEAAEIEAKYRHLHRSLKRYQARMEARGGEADAPDDGAAPAPRDRH